MALSNGPDAARERPRVLVLRALGLGDLLTAVPALRALRRALPDHELVLAAPEPLRPLVELAGAVDRLVDVRGLEPLSWDGGPPELAVDLHGCGPESHRLLQALAPSSLVAFSCDDAAHRGPRWDADEHEVERWCRLVEESLGVPADPADLRLAGPRVPAPVPRSVVVHPGAAYPARRWPAERFAEVTRWIAERGHRVVVTGSAGESGLAAEVLRLAGVPPGCSLAGRTDLAQLTAQVASAPLVVSGDTGTAHVATAYGVPSVLLFGPTPPSRWGPRPGGPHEVLWHGAGVGDPWAEEPDPALLAIGVPEVVAAAARRLGELAGAAE